MFLKVGFSPARVRGDGEGVLPGCRQTALELVGEQEVRELALTVGSLRFVPLLPVQIGEANCTQLEREMSKVVDSELRLEPPALSSRTEGP